MEFVSWKPYLLLFWCFLCNCWRCLIRVKNRQQPSLAHLRAAASLLGPDVGAKVGSAGFCTDVACSSSFAPLRFLKKVHFWLCFMFLDLVSAFCAYSTSIHGNRCLRSLSIDIYHQHKPKKEEIYMNTHIYMWYWPISTCTLELSWMQKQGVETSETRSKLRFSRKRKGAKGEEGHIPEKNQAEPTTPPRSRPTKQAAGQRQGRGGHTRLARALDAAAPPWPLPWPSQLVLVHWRQRRMVQAWAWEYSPQDPPHSLLYKEGEAPPYTHTTLHSSLAQGALHSLHLSSHLA
jgi:hypothetical protein